MTICATSDWHDQFKLYLPQLKLVEADVLVIAGDITHFGDEFSSILALTYFESLTNFKHKILLAGNHDFWFEKKFRDKATRELAKNMYYLHDSGITIEGRHFWGSPYTEKFGNWAFMYDPKQAKRRWQMIPDQVEVLITHGPPKTILDTLPNTNKGPLGCQALYDRVKQVQPTHHIFGHIHSGHGQAVRPTEFKTLFSNVSLCNEQN